MTFEYLVSHYGYVALVIGTFFEGETILIAAGFAAHGGYLKLQWVTLAAFLGSLAGDQFYIIVQKQWELAGQFALSPKYQQMVKEKLEALQTQGKIPREWKLGFGGFN